jgi:hypothetical protein
MLAVGGDDPALLPAVEPDGAPPAAAAAPPPPSGTADPFVLRAGPGVGNLPARIAAYLARLPNLGEGQGRDDVAYHFAAFLARDLALGDDVALSWLGRWDAGNSPPKGPEALAEILANARRYGRRPVGAGRVATRPPRRTAHSTIRFTVEIP